MDDLSASFREDLSKGLDASVLSAKTVRGGDIHQAFRVDLDDGRRVFIKTSERTPAGLFEAEAAGLNWLAGFGRDQRGDRPGWLALTWADSIGRGGNASLGADLARLHDHAVARPGWQRDVFIGPLPQDNAVEHEMDWPTFWAERRLAPMVAMAASGLNATQQQLVEQVCDRCPDLLADVEHLGPLHGDLWNGNVLYGEAGPLLIDPAVYAGDPEVDLAMMELFGGFGAEVWSSYFAIRPRRPGFEMRRDLYQLWPLLVHVTLFGSGYGSGVERAARRVLDA
jgi:fructosamine-3-kinase